MDIKTIEKISKALADTNRLKILLDMSKQNGMIQCAEIMTKVKLAQPSVSHHIKTLTEAGLIEAEKDGRNHSYSLNHSLLKAYAGWINAIAGKE